MDEHDLDELEKIGYLLRFLDEDHVISQDAMSIVYGAGKTVTDLVDRLRAERRVRLALRAECV